MRYSDLRRIDKKDLRVWAYHLVDLAWTNLWLEATQEFLPSPLVTFALLPTGADSRTTVPVTRGRIVIINKQRCIFGNAALWTTRERNEPRRTAFVYGARERRSEVAGARFSTSDSHEVSFKRGACLNTDADCGRHSVGVRGSGGLPVRPGASSVAPWGFSRGQR
ncbi:hypothetical protein CK203_108017 [Vitis vinifera]|uniref:Uncharacterized protein n=1 Tax=Vitis vinifera TaxID=29760 RepID=A0A438C413_VITVI|nr:hypothetical protein CK203_108017 [Vitis vinifera]